MPEVRGAISACAVGNDIYVFGGEYEQSVYYRYDTIADTWTMLAPMPIVSDHHSASAVGGFIYIVDAGYDGAQVLRFGMALNVWSTMTPTSVVYHGASFVVGGSLYV
jgi:N-acetylneuraminic acid mutarotase